MKKYLLVVTALLLCAVTMFAQTNIWTQKADFGGIARRDATGFSIGNKGYIGCGYSDLYSDMNKDFWEYDPANNTWTQKADFGGGKRAEVVGFSIGDKGYMGVGEAINFVQHKDFWEYDPAANTWTRKADFGGHERAFSTGFSIGNKGYIGTGISRTCPGCDTYYTDFWEYDQGTDKWTRKADFAGGSRSNPSSFSIGKKGYIGVGFGGGKDFWEYDPATDKWTRKADFGGSAREWAASFSINNKGYIGTAYGTNARDFWEYDPVINAWTRKADFGGSGRGEAVGFSIGGKGYIGTGSGNGGNTKDFWEYTPECVQPDPPGKIKGQTVDLCGGGKFNYQIDEVPDALYYTWTAPANTSIIAGQNSTTIRLKINSNFAGGDLSVTANNLCGSSDPSTTVLNVKPAKPSAIEGPSAVSAQQQGIVFSVKDKGVVYNWSLVPVDAVITSGWGTNKITVTWGSTNGYVAVSASNGCGLSETRPKAVALNESIASAVNSNHVKAENIQKAFTAYPNPAKNTSTVIFTNAKSGNYSLEVTDMTGKVLLLKKGTASVGENRIMFDMGKFAHGMYFINLTDNGNGRRSLKLNKE